VRVTATGRDFTFTGGGFGPGEPVSAKVASTPVDLGTKQAGADGSVVFNWTAPADFPAGAHQVTLTGVTTGAVTVGFTVLSAGDTTAPSAGPTSARSTSGSTGPAPTPTGPGQGSTLSGTGTSAPNPISWPLALWLLPAGGALVIAWRLRTVRR